MQPGAPAHTPAHGIERQFRCPGSARCGALGAGSWQLAAPAGIGALWRHFKFRPYKAPQTEREREGGAYNKKSEIPARTAAFNWSRTRTPRKPSGALYLRGYYTATATAEA